MITYLCFITWLYSFIAASFWPSFCNAYPICVLRHTNETISHAKGYVSYYHCYHHNRNIILATFITFIWPTDVPLQFRDNYEHFRCLLNRQVTSLVVREVRSAGYRATSLQHTSSCDYFSPTSVLSHAFSVLCVHSKFVHHPHPLDYLCAKFCFFHGLHCWASRWRKIVYSLTHSLTQLIWCPGKQSLCFWTFVLLRLQGLMTCCL